MPPREELLLTRLREATLALHQTLDERDALLQQKSEPIAIIGIGCRFPGGADSPDAFWELLDAGRDAIVPLAPRWAFLGVQPGEEVPRWAGLLTGSIDEFDAAFFGISPREARSLDPQHRLLLEVGWEALEDAAIPPRSLLGSRTGIFIGACATDYLQAVAQQPPEEQDAYRTTGNLLSVAAGRLAYTLGLQGPCLTVDTACSSSLVAIHLACTSLRTRESELALAGGVNLILSADTMQALGRTQALSPDGRCRTFDASANGFVRGEGCGLLVLKRLSEAQRDGDRIWAVIRGSAINQDGRSTGLTAPNVLAQEALLRQALMNAGVEAGAIDYVETHGTGTVLGDPIEVQALRAVVGEVQPGRPRCVLGAVKTNIGHLEGAAGVAGVIKAALALWHERMPKNLNFRTLNAHIELAGSSLQLATEPQAWPRGQRARFAGVSSFGLSGTNAHVVLQEAPAAARAPAAREREERAAELILLSGQSPSAVAAQAAQLLQHLLRHPEFALRDIAYSLAATRSVLEERLALTTTGAAALRAALARAAQGDAPAGAVRGTANPSRGKLAFLFTGQGAQRPGMGQGLYAAWPAFREAFDRCTALFDRELARPLRAVMWAAADSAEAPLLDQTVYTQPALFALAHGLYALWRSLGIAPDVVAGHSIGELAAACAAGVFSLEDAVRLCAARGRLMQALPAGGAMVSIAASEAAVAEAVAPHRAQVAIAAVNGPTQVVISGAAAAVASIAASFAGRGVQTRALLVSHAFHSPLMEPMLAAFRRVAESVTYGRPQLPLVSMLSGTRWTEQECTAEYWVRHARDTIRFAAAAQALQGAGATTFVEVGPRPTLLALLPACLPDADCSLHATLQGGRDEAASVMEALGGLWTRGWPIASAGLFPGGGRQVPLPAYAWQRQRYWIGRPARSTVGAAEPLGNLIYQVDWPELRRAAEDPAPTAGHWLILADRSGVGHALSAALSSRGQVCTVLTAPTEAAVLRTHLADALGCQGVVYLWGLDASPDASTSASEMGEITHRAAAPLLALAQAVAGRATAPRVWIVTRRACPVGHDPVVVPCQAALWGIGRVVGLEHPMAWGGLLDLDAHVGTPEVAALVAELLSADDETEIAFRHGRRHVARLVPAALETPTAPLALSPEATYLVTGGLGGLGLLAARWLVARGARHLLLTGRHGRHTPGAEAALAALQAQGAQVRAEAVDVADAAAMGRLLATVAPPLRGVLHCAGVRPAAPLRAIDEALLAEALRAKVIGSWVLHQLLGDRPLDLFVLFSSGAAVWGGADQGAYAAANAFLDGLAHYRRSQSLPALSVSWGVWELGRLADAQTREQLAQIGVLALPADAAFVALERLLLGGAAHGTVARVDWARLAPVYAAHGRRKLFALLAASDPPQHPAAPPVSPQRPGEMAGPLGRAALAKLVRRTVAQILGFDDPRALDGRRGFAELGLDSLMAMQLRTRLQERLRIPLSATLAFDYPSLDRLVAYLQSAVVPPPPRSEPEPLPAAAPDEPIAIIGAACRLPGGAADLNGLWQLLARGDRAFGAAPASRWNPADSQAPEALVRGGFLHELEGCDADFFQLSPREALSLDPQQRLLMEVGWESLEHAGQDPAALRETATGVFVGAGPSEYAEHLQGLTAEAAGPHAGTGNLLSVLAGRLSYFLGLHGPSLVVDTACSSSLVALHLGCQSLRQRECEMALVGGVNVLLSPRPFALLSRMGVLSEDGRCQPFAAAANGYVRAEGCVVVVLKRLADAQRSRDRILAVIRGSAVNHDGASSSLTAPCGPAQQAVLHKALQHAGVTPPEVDFVECHGTATALGDPIEVQALGAVYGRCRATDRPLVLGAVKANLGHLEAAAGLVGVLKVVLSLQHEEIPAQPELDALNPRIPWAELPLSVARQAWPWPREARPRRAGVSAFGMSGTNAHVVLEEAPEEAPAPAARARAAELVVLSARSAAALAGQAARLRDHLQEHPELALADVAYSLLRTRGALTHRLAIVAPSHQGLLAALELAAQGQTPAEAVRGSVGPGEAPKVVFIFPGQGGQWLGMGRALLDQEPSFRAALADCDRAIQAEAGFSVVAELCCDPATSRLDQIDVVQPVLFALQVALAALWRSYGVVPDAVVGHSLGEVAAAQVAGALSLHDAVAIICRRSRLLRRRRGQGEMALVALSQAEVERALHGQEARLSVAALNGPRATVIAGESAALAEVLATLTEQGVFWRRIEVDVASHCPQVDALLEELRTALAAIVPRATGVPMRSTVTGALVAGPELGAEYWAANLRQPVLFAASVQALLESGHRLFVEVNPHPVLLPAVQELMQTAHHEGAAVGSLRRGQPERATLLAALAALWAAGHKVTWDSLFPGGGALVPLPSYAWQRHRYWVDRPSRQPPQPPVLPGCSGRWPLSGTAIRSPGVGLHHVLTIGPRHQPFLADHVVFGKVVVPGAFHLAVILSIATERWPERIIALTGVEFLRALALGPDQQAELHAVLSPEAEGEGYRFELASPDGPEQQPRWTTHVRGRAGPTDRVPGRLPRPAELTPQTCREVDSATLLGGLAAVQIGWGPQWRWLQQAQLGDGAAQAVLVPRGDADAVAPLHPVLLDNAFAVSQLQRLVQPEDDTPRLPFAVERLLFHRAPLGRVRCRSVASPPAGEAASFVLVDEDGTVIGEVESFLCRRAPREAFLRPDADLPGGALYQLEWPEAPASRESAAGSADSWVVVAAEGAPATALTERLGGCARVSPYDLGAFLSPGVSPVHVVCLWDAGAHESPVAAAQRLAAEGLAVAQALSGAGPSRSFWLTRSAVAVQPTELVAVAASTIWGLGRTLMQEHPGLGCTLLDLGPGTDPGAAVLRELVCRDRENQVAWRDSRRYVARLVRAGEQRGESRPLLSGPGTVVLTGGLGALGLRVARWLARQGVAHLLLIGRRGMDTPGAAAAVAELQALGARVTVAAVDVAERAALGHVLAAVPPELPLRGVVHAAGVLDDGVIAEQTAERFVQVLRPKVAGAFNLHELTAGCELDFFVLFSSLIGLLGGAGQSSHAAANAFLDALAAYRRAQGLAGQSLGWGAWAEAGLAAALDATQRARLAQQGFKWMSAAEGLSLFAHALQRKEAHLGIALLDLQALSRRFAAAIPPLWRELVHAPVDPDGRRAQESFTAWLAQLPPADRVAEVQAAVRTEVARVLALSSASAVPLTRSLKDLGLDSLMHLELRNALAQRLGRPLSLSQIFAHPSIEGLSGWLLAHLGDLGEPAGTEVPANLSLPPAEPLVSAGSGVEPPSPRVVAPELAPVPLSSGQARLWFLSRLIPESSLYNVCVELRVRGWLDREALQRSLAALVARHDVLRMTFPEHEASPHAVVAARLDFALPWVDLSRLDRDQKERELAGLAAGNRSAGFDLAGGPLWRVVLISLTRYEHVLLFCQHHIITDGWSLRILVSELGELYGAFAHGASASLPELPIHYADYARWQKASLESEEIKRSTTWWKEQLSGVEPLELPVSGTPAAAMTHAGAAHAFALSPTLSRELRELAHREGCTLFVTLLAGWAALLHRYSQQDAFTIGTVSAGRDRAELAGLLGFFVNTLVLRCDVSGNPAFRTLMHRMRCVLADAAEHAAVPFDEVVKTCGAVRGRGLNPLFQTCFVVQTFSVPDQERAGTSWSAVFERPDGGVAGTTKFELSLTVMEHQGALVGMLEYATDLFQAPLIERMAGHYQVLLDAAVHAPAAPLAALPLLTEAERHQFLTQWDAPRAAWPHSTCLHHLFEAQVARAPDAIAVVCEDRQLTYGQLNQRANQLAHHLRSLGTGPDVLVALCVERSLEMVIGLLGILKAGGAYVPIDPDYPQERIAFMLQDAAPRVVVTTRSVCSRLPASAAAAVCIDDDVAAPATNPAPLAAAHNLAYVIYTSGSTGQPKGALLSHHNACRLLHTTAPWFRFAATDVWTLFHSISFDFSVWELWGALAYGGRVVVVPYWTTRSAADLFALLLRHQVTVLNQTPSAFYALIEAARARADQRLALRYVILGGEALRLESLRPWFTLHGDKQPQLVNMYGITETTVHVTYRPLQASELDSASGSDVGRPLPDLAAYILDAHLNLVPVGVPGELFIGGEGVARGYLNRPALTAQKFIAHPFSHQPGARLYKTGDRARFRPDGSIEFLGRLDQQVKLRGFRIELGEIESALAAHPDVASCVVSLREDTPGSKRLAAYVVPIEGRSFDAQALRTYLLQKLPDYMQPTALVPLPALPLSPSGKVDRKALPAPAGEHSTPDGAAPRGPAEQILAELFAAVLHLDRVSRDDDFFVLGGDSILSIQVVARAASAGLAISVEQLFRNPTPARLAPLVRQQQRGLPASRFLAGPVPLTPIQRWLLDDRRSPLEHFNQAMMLELQGQADQALLVQALTAVHQQQDVFRLRFRFDEAGAVQYAQDGAALFSLDQAFVATAPDEAQRSAQIDTMTRALQAGFTLSTGPLSKLLLIEGPPGTPALLFWVIHHLVVDAVSWMVLLGDLAAAYTQLRSGQAPQLAPVAASFAAWSARLQELTASAALKRQRAYWLFVLATPGRLPSDSSDSGSGHDSVGAAVTVATTLDRITTERLGRAAAAVCGANLGEALLAALAKVLCGRVAGDALRIDVESHGRDPELAAALDLSRTVGWFTSLFPLALPLVAVSPRRALKHAKDALRVAPHSGVGFGALRYLVGDPELQSALARLGESELCFNYLGQMDAGLAEKAWFRLRPQPSRQAVSPLRRRAYPLELNAYKLAGCLRIEWTYSPARHRPATIAAWAAALESALHALLADCAQVADGGHTPSDFPYCGLSQGGLELALQHLGIKGRDSVADIYPLSPMQHGMLFHTLLSPGTGVYYEQLTLTLRGPLEPTLMQRAWQHVLQQQPVLRSAFVMDAAHPVQVVRLECELPFTRHDYSHLDAPAAEQALATLCQRRRRDGFALRHAPLLRVDVVQRATGLWSLVLGFHHALMDGWSWPRVFAQVSAAYQALLQGATPAFTPGRSMRDFLVHLQDTDLQAAECYFRNALRGLSAPSPLPGRITPDDDQRHPDKQPAQHMRRLPGALSARLQQISRAVGVTINSLLQTAWAVVLGRMAGCDDVLFGATVAGRPAELPDIEERVGLYINTLPVRVRLDLNRSPIELARAVQAEQALSRDFQGVSLTQVQRWIQGPAGPPLFDSVLVFENYPLDLQALQHWSGLDLAGITVHEMSSFALALWIVPGTEYLLQAEYDERQFAPGSVEEVIGCLQTLLEGIAAHPQARLCDLPLRRPGDERCAGLPAAMTPPSALPRLPGGQLAGGAASRAAAERPDADCAPPRSPLEHALSAIFCTVLGVERVGRDADFFALGGDSFLALRVVGQAQQVGIPLTLRQLLSGASVAAAAAHVTESAQGSCLLKLQGGDAAGAVVLVPAAGGIFLRVGELLSALAVNAPVYALLPPCIRGAPPPLTLVELVGPYEQEIRARIPAGPLVLIGHRLGGLVALELGHQLLQRGRAVAQLIIAEAAPPPLTPASPCDPCAELRNILDGLCAPAEQLAGMEFPAALAQVARVLTLDRGGANAMAAFLQSLVESAQLAQRLSATWEPRVPPAPVHLLRAAGTRARAAHDHADSDGGNGWLRHGALASVQWTAGQPDDILRAPFLASTALLIRALLAQGGLGTMLR